MGDLPFGKLPISLLSSTVLRLTGAKSPMVVTPPKAGLDFAAVKLSDGYLLVSADPVTGVVDEIGRYAVTVSANDVATSGNRPQFLESVVLLPKGSTPGDVERVAMQVDDAAKEGNMAIVGGHTEVTPGLEHPVVVITAFCLAKRFVTSGGARSGDSILMTKTAGVEGTAVLAGRVAGRGGKSISRKFISQLSVVREAVAGFESGMVTAMHDCTEGGVLGAVFEMSLASGTGFEVKAKDIPVAKETEQICERFSADPLRLIGSGSLLLAVKEGEEREVESALRSISKVTRIGRFVDGKREMLASDGKRKTLTEAPEDELWRVLGRAS